MDATQQTAAQREAFVFAQLDDLAEEIRHSSHIIAKFRMKDKMPPSKGFDMFSYYIFIGLALACMWFGLSNYTAAIAVVIACWFVYRLHTVQYPSNIPKLAQKGRKIYNAEINRLRNEIYKFYDLVALAKSEDKEQAVAAKKTLSSYPNVLMEHSRWCNLDLVYREFDIDLGEASQNIVMLRDYCQDRGIRY